MDFARYAKPALIGGLVIGVPSALPYLNLACVCCFLYVWIGSVLASYLLFKRFPDGTLGDGSLVGLLSGIFGSVFYIAIELPLVLVMQKSFDPFENIPADQIEAMPQEMMDVLEFMANMSTGQMLGVMAGYFVVALALFALLGTLGGLIGAAIFRKKEQPEQVEL